MNKKGRNIYIQYTLTHWFVFIYSFTCKHIFMYMGIYNERERERENPENQSQKLHSDRPIVQVAT